MGTGELVGDELATLYRQRFTDTELAAKRRLWSALYDGFLRRYVRLEDTVLDLGAGTCEFINACHAERRIAVDPNPETRHWADRGAQVVLGSGDHLPEIATGSIDVVFTSNVFEHLPDKRTLLATLGECRRVLRVGGRIMVLMPNLRYVGVRYWDYFDHHLPLTHLSLVEGLGIAGFVPDRVIPRFVPYTVKDSPVRVSRGLVLTYLRMPLLWRIWGRQMFVSATSPGPPAGVG